LWFFGQKLGSYGYKWRNQFFHKLIVKMKKIHYRILELLC
jgi:hypothetical protein